MNNTVADKSHRTHLIAEQRTKAITHPEKLLFPNDGYTKLDVAEYYVQVAPQLLRHIRNRALTLKRFPQGIHQTGFFQKNKPSNTPDWIPSVRTGIIQSDFLIINDAKTLLWVINQNTIELHQSHGRMPEIDFADYVVFDLDPPLNTPFEWIAGVALNLKACIEDMGFTAFVKTSGGKGLHILFPIKPEADPSRILRICRAIIESYPEPESITTEQRKHKRGKRIYLDLTRNYSGQTIVAPYSLRARPTAPVSTPLTWHELAQIKDSIDFNLKTVLKRMMKIEDPWKEFSHHAINLANFKIKE
jgi:bifunctional non-homologous end joining protein LigD